jgi:hypothetical protein
MEGVDTLKSASLGERLLAGRDEKQAEQGEMTGRIECVGGYIVSHYRALSFREDRKIGLRHKAVADIVEKEVRAAADTLAASSTRCEVHIGDETHEMPPLGLGLSQALGLDGPENDIQAVLALFPSERAMVEQFIELEEWASAVNAAVDGQIEGNSEAATS